MSSRRAIGLVAVVSCISRISAITNLEWYSGVSFGGWAGAKQYCLERGGVMPWYDAVCPDGKGMAPNGGVKSGWVPYDNGTIGSNTWIKVDSSVIVCYTFEEIVGENARSEWLGATDPLVHLHIACGHRTSTTNTTTTTVTSTTLTTTNITTTTSTTSTNTTTTTVTSTTLNTTTTTQTTSTNTTTTTTFTTTTINTTTTTSTATSSTTNTTTITSTTSTSTFTTSNTTTITSTTTTTTTFSTSTNTTSYHTTTTNITETSTTATTTTPPCEPLAPVHHHVWETVDFWWGVLWGILGLLFFQILVGGGAFAYWYFRIKGKAAGKDVAEDTKELRADDIKESDISDLEQQHAQELQSLRAENGLLRSQTTSMEGDLQRVKEDAKNAMQRAEEAKLDLQRATDEAKREETLKLWIQVQDEQAPSSTVPAPFPEEPANTVLENAQLLQSQTPASARLSPLRMLDSCGIGSADSANQLPELQTPQRRSNCSSCGF